MKNKKPFFWSVCSSLILLLAVDVNCLAQYQCTPCTLNCDTLTFPLAGTCPHCQMALEPIPQQVTADEAFEKIAHLADSSTIMQSLGFLADVYGPRFFGTPRYFEAATWAKETLEKWGIDKAELLPYYRQQIGWDFEGFSMEMTSPSYAPMQVFPLAFTRSTKGIQVGETLIIDSFEEVFEMKGNLKDKILLLKQYYYPVSSHFAPMASRFSEEILTAAQANDDPNNQLIGYHSRRCTADIFGMREEVQKSRAEFFEFCEQEGVIALIEPSDFPYGILHADGNRAIPSFPKKGSTKPIASFVMANEHFGRLLRITEMGLQPKLKVNLKSKWYDEPDYHVNVLAEIEGSDPELKEELVIIGAHLDSWHAGTGAVDNAASCAVMMEAMRLIRESGIQAKRTIRLVLWGGEEQIFAGSYDYVDDRIGDMETGKRKEEHPKISAYLNLDNGAGKIRGLYLMGNKAIEPYFAEYLHPFPESQTLTVQQANQTDHELFDYHNVPAFQFIQDPLDYINAIHHTNLDVLEYVPEADQIHNAQVVAYLAYRIANAEEQMPRKPFNSPIPNREGNTTFSLKGFENAKRVSLIGDFNNWDMFGTPLYRTDKGWEVKIDLPEGRYYYKFIVDGQWTADPATPETELVKDGKGHGGLTIFTKD